VQKFLGHSYVKEMIPPFLSKMETVKLQHHIVSSIREGMKEHLVGVKPSKIVIAKDILYTLASSSATRSGRALASVLEVERRNILKARDRCQVLDATKDAFWLQNHKKIRSDSLASNVRASMLLQ
jgi:hypothetical protein